MAVTLRQLEYLVAIAETGSLTAAARRCHVSPGGVSIAMDQLEQSLHVQVALRSKARGAKLTPAGTWVAQQARRILTDVETLRYAQQRVHGELVGTLKVGCYDPLSPWLVPRLVEDFGMLHAALDIELVEAGPTVLQKRLLEGELDACFIHAAHALRAVTTHHVLPIRLHVVVHADHPLAQSDSVNLEMLDGEPAVLLGLEPTREIAESLLRNAGVESRIRIVSSNVETVRELVARKAGFSFLMGRPPTDTFVDNLPLVYLPITDSLPENSVVVAHAPSNIPSPNLQALVDWAGTAFAAAPAHPTA
ncbi:LysR family transcriptional regulator [Rhodococcus sp. ZPP]|uniref:LysR family transcriptional regulator n=1 Tax=Rhodococcus sp. ZPP TaxID=2749906 RepID=UPI001AD89AF5|nr:LysR family transcriptional regulator [Rhodococcus sp. ZPP]QTJ66835.1 LysR family transcriptional regulator [Rhodococcus sp. ZPP]